MDSNKRSPKELKLDILRSSLLSIVRSHLPFQPLFFDEGYLKLESGKEGGLAVMSLKDALKAAQNEIYAFIETEECLANAVMSASGQHNSAEATREDFAGLTNFARELLWEEEQSYRLIKDAFLGMQLAKSRECYDERLQPQLLNGRQILYFYDGLAANSYSRRFIYFIESIQRVRDQEKIKNCELLHHDLFMPTDIPDAYAITKFTREKDKPFAVHPNTTLPPDKAEKGLHTIVSNLVRGYPDKSHWVQLARDMSDAAARDNLAYFFENSADLEGDVRFVLHSTANQDFYSSAGFSRNIAAYTVGITKALAMRRRSRGAFL
ncbi:hypothetical protein HZB03_05845 [Candidatus Woesearchaeota archaeon]|nr:hypothetical protein [Candidatus Woesearchaeota archaeon]